MKTTPSKKGKHSKDAKHLLNAKNASSVKSPGVAFIQKTTPIQSGIRSPVSQFATGFKPQPIAFNQKDYRHKLDYIALACGVLLLWFEQASKAEEPYLVHDYNQLRDHSDIRTRLGVLGVTQQSCLIPGPVLNLHSKSCRILGVMNLPELQLMKVQHHYIYKPTHTTIAFNLILLITTYCS